MPTFPMQPTGAAPKEFPGFEMLSGKEFARPDPLGIVTEDIANIGDIIKAIVTSPWLLARLIGEEVDKPGEAFESSLRQAPSPQELGYPGAELPLMSFLPSPAELAAPPSPAAPATAPAPIPLPSPGGPAAAPAPLLDAGREMTLQPGGALGLPPEAPAPSPLLAPAATAPEPKEEAGVGFAELPGEELGALRRLVEEALAGGREVEVTTPEGQLLPFAQAPPGTYGAGGYFDPEGGPLTLMRQAPPGPSDEELMEKIMENPYAAMQKLELGMGKRGTHPDQRPATRLALAELLLKAGFNPGITNSYASSPNPLGDPDLNKMLSQEFSVERAGQLELSRQLGYEKRQMVAKIALAQEAEATRKRLMWFEVMIPSILRELVEKGELPESVLSGVGGGTTARMTDQQRKMLIQQAKDMGKRGVAFTVPTGQLVTILFKHKLGLLRSNVKENRAFRSEVLQLLKADKGFPQDIDVFDMKPVKVPLGGRDLPFMGGGGPPSEEGKETNRVRKAAQEALSGR